MDKDQRRKATEYQLRYQKDRLMRVCISLDKETDKDIIESLERRGDISMQRYIKKILRDNIVG